MRAQLCVAYGFLLFLSSGILLSCSNKENPPEANFNTTDVTVQPDVVYGNDDRLDFFEIQNPMWKELASSTVALISGSKVSAAPGGFNIKSAHYGTSLGLCHYEPYYNQISAAFCSGSLIAPDVIMTAGHCVRTLKSCQTMRFVFNFAYQSPGADPSFAATDDVYTCKDLIHTKADAKTNTDYSLIRLDRKVVGHKPLAIRRTGRIQLGEPLVVIGHPKGLPLKMAGGAKVRSNYHRYYFSSNLDTYDGNSGSAVFNEWTGLVEGILVRGEQDFAYDDGCYHSKVCGDERCRGEDVTRVSEVLKHLGPSELE